MESFSLFEVFLILGIGQGVFLIFAIASVKEQNKVANTLLTLIILTATIMLTGRVLSFFLQVEWVIRFAQFVDASILLFGPIVYFYIRRLAKPRSNRNRPLFWHFIPALAHFFFSIWTCFISMTELNEMYWSGNLMYILIGVELAGLVSLVCYWVAGCIFLRKAFNEPDSTLQGYLSGIKGYLISFLFFVGTVGLFWVSSFVGKVWQVWPLTLISYELLWAVAPLFFYSLGYYSLLKPSILREPSLPKAQRDRLDFSASQILKTRLNYLMTEEKLYSRPDLTLKDLAARLETSPNNLSWLLNKVHQKTFYDYVNEIRVDAFKEKIANNEHLLHTLFALALEVGFNSKSTFNKSFKSVIGETPSEYVKKRSQKKYEGTQ